MIKPHDRIWLQWEEYDDDVGVTWERDKINDTDVEYVRKDIFDALNRNYVELQEMYTELLDEFLGEKK